MKNSILNLSIILICGLFLILGCSGAKDSNTGNTATAPINSTANKTAGETPAEKPIAIQAKALTKEYDENELAADGKYKDKLLAVSGKVSNIAETLGNVTAQLEGHDFTKSVMCNFDESEKSNVAKLKKGQTATFIGTGDGMTGGLYVGLQKCKIQ